MDYEFHYYINYLIAKFGGFSPDDCYKIAYSAQYIDDNCTEYTVLCKDNHEVFTNNITQTYDLTISEKIRNKIYSTFHFTPGNEPHAQRVDGKVHPLATTPNCKLANKLLDDALLNGNPYTIGIASHVFADTWAHQNFTATKDDFNSGHSLVAKLLPNIGHVDFLELPDLVGITWHDTRLKEYCIFNNQRFIDCAEALLIKYASHNGILCNTKKLRTYLTKTFGDSVVFNPLTFYLKRARRIKHYKNKVPSYDSTLWFHQAVSMVVDGYYWNNDDYKESDWYQFQQAVKYFIMNYLTTSR